jgi:hypothetical protein
MFSSPPEQNILNLHLGNLKSQTCFMVTGTHTHTLTAKTGYQFGTITCVQGAVASIGLTYEHTVNCISNSRKEFRPYLQFVSISN